MIDFSNEIFNAVALELRSLFPQLQVKGEYVDVPAAFPCLAIDEIRNIPAHLDSGKRNKYAAVTYRIQVFSNLESGKRAQAREIYAAADEILMGLGLFCKSYTTTPAIYNAEIYSITATYEGVIDATGVIYRG